MAYKQLKLWFDEELAKMLVKKIQPHYPEFNKRTFVQKTKKGVPTLELKARVEFMADLLQDHLPDKFSDGWKIIAQTLGPENEKETGMFTEGYWLMPVAKWVEKYGLDDFKTAMKANEEVTKRHTSEYSIRPYLEKYTDRTLKMMLKWSKSKNKHVRRLASEGVRPKLPWAKKLQIFVDDPKLILPILENLKDDDSKYVQKSVGNCLNDILKDNFELGFQTLQNWAKNAPSPARKWIIKHALRNFIKKENKEALKIMKNLA